MSFPLTRRGRAKGGALFQARFASLRAGLRRKEKLFCASYGTTKVVP